MPDFISSPLIKENLVEARLYQEILAANILEKGNSLVVAPTALGKTVVAALVAAELLNKNPNAKVLFLAPTKPLAAQHQKSLQKILKIEPEKIELFTGSKKPSEREQQWQSSTIIAATPQAIENDLVSGRIDFADIALLIFDEAHRAVGDYAYVFIAQRYIKQAKAPLILALTASPGGNAEKIQDVCKNLFIKNLEIKTHADADVAPYVHEIKLEWQTVDLPQDFFEIKQLFQEFMKDQLLFLKKLGYAKNIFPNFMKKKDLIALQVRIRADFSTRAKTNPAIYHAASKLAALLKVSHAELLLETQGINVLQAYLEKMKSASTQQGSPKALKTILADERVQKAMNMSQQLFDKHVLHPKQELLKEILLKQFLENPQSRVIVFNHYRESVRTLTDFLKQFPQIKPLRFVGQATKETDKGMNQKEQVESIKRFAEGEFNVMVASSVAEEGLDIPTVDLVIFFEPVPSAIRAIQRRGRTGRLSKGRVIVLMAKRTRDEAFYWASVSKERKMHSTLRAMKKIGIASQPKQAENAALPKQTTLLKFAENAKDKVVIYADTREQASGVVRELSEKEVLLKVKQLEIGDFVLSDDIIVERKTTEDFLQSMIDGRLFHQLIKMNENYKMPLMIIEGNQEELFTLRNIHRNAILGAITSIMLNYRTPIIFTKDAKETAELLFVTAKREQLAKDKDIRLRTGRKGLTLTETQQFVVESLPMVGPTMAKSLLKKFKSVRNIINASREDLMKVENLGEKKASRIRRLATARYNPNRKPKAEKAKPAEKTEDSTEKIEAVAENSEETS